MGLFMVTRGRTATTPLSNNCSVTDLEACIARHDSHGITRDMLPTPCRVVDLEMFKANVNHMANTANANDINLKTSRQAHKSVDVAK